ncbi:DUF3459 domain-containing protein [Candidatus Saccharibacteria bacterium]|nr:DUF3459 domain-containing protein [Candidatus Saccharibacteria bacterium]NCU40639.1 DUF3459 domain-containing protein [Candidatus Saccharibacteria bacterium]
MPWNDVGVVYQIYPRSFLDTNNDGIGDLPGIIDKLDYVKNIVGADAIWLSPIYLSPQEDLGYDIASYTQIAPEYGTMQNIEQLIDQAHKIGLKVMFDIVPNHTSDQHEWFQESRANRHSPKRDWYVWRDPQADGSPPNNWRSMAGGQSWTLDDNTGQYYLHSFLSSQPDLNWENPRVREAIKSVCRYWFRKGVDGFRVDAVWVVSKDPELRDDPLWDNWPKDAQSYNAYRHTMCKNGPRLIEYLKDMISVAHEFRDKYFLFEYYADDQHGDMNEQLYSLHNLDPEVATTFYFEGMHFDWHAEHCADTLSQYISGLSSQARPVFCFSNHDQPRIVSRFGGEEQARLIAMLQMTLPGMPCIYYGEEIGMRNVTSDESVDSFDNNSPMGGRDPERTPMQWNTSDYAGFSSIHPWLPVANDYTSKNAAQELNDVRSFLTLYRYLIGLRKNHRALRHGKFNLRHTGNGYILAYTMSNDEESLGIFLNFADDEQTASVGQPFEILQTTHPDATVRLIDDNQLILGRFVGCLVQLK